MTGLSAVAAEEQRKLAAGETVNAWVSKLFETLDLPAEAVERTVGMVSQVIDSATDPEKYGKLEDILAHDPKSAWEAGGLTWHVAFMANKEGVVELTQLTEPGTKQWTTEGR